MPARDGTRFQTYLRELRPSDLEGSAGLYRLKEELTRRVNVAIAPSRIKRCAVQRKSSCSSRRVETTLNRNGSQRWQTARTKSTRMPLAAEWGLKP